MFCTNCGMQIPDGTKFCMNCGSPVGAVVPPSDQPAPVQEPVADVPPQAAPEPASAPEPEPAPEPVPEPAPASEPAPFAQPEPAPEPAPFAQPAPAPEPAPFAQPEPASGYAAVPSKAQAMPGAPEQAQPSPYAMPAQQQPTAPQQGMGVPGGPVPPQPYGAQPPAGGPQPQPKSSSKTPLIIGIAAVVVVAAIIIAGFATNWFGMGGGAFGGSSSGAAPAGDDKAVYVLKSRTNYEADGDLAYVYETERNDRGDIEKTVSESYTNGKLQATFTVTYDRDDNGYATKRKETNDFEDTSTPSKNTYTFDNEFDKDGLLKTATSSEEETTYKYFDNGREKSYVTERSSGSTSCEYDENGYEQTYAYEYKSGSFSVKITHELEWEFDKNGYPTGYTISGKQTSNGQTSSDKKECTIEVDDHGNITAIYDEKGTLRSKLEWTRIEDPSPAIVSQNVKPMYMVLEF